MKTEMEKDWLSRIQKWFTVERKVWLIRIRNWLFGLVLVVFGDKQFSFAESDFLGNILHFILGGSFILLVSGVIEFLIKRTFRRQIYEVQIFVLLIILLNFAWSFKM